MPETEIPPALRGIFIVLPESFRHPHGWLFVFEKGDVDVLFEFWKSIYNFSLDFSLQCFLNFIYSKQFVFPYLVKRDKYEKIIAKILKL